VNQPFAHREFRRAQPRLAPREQAVAQWRRWDWSAEEKARQRPARSTAEIMPSVLRGIRFDSRQAETEILKVWHYQMDPNIVAHAQPTGLRRGTLFVTVDSSVWLDEIVRYRRHEILERLRNSFGPDLIARISFRTG
jgi:predicted nucleic acid-binding Zn ribbon protein